MSKSKKIAGLGFLLMAICAMGIGQTKLIEKVVAQPGKLVIPYEKYELENGLTLIIHEDHSDPVVHVDVTYHVGSAREEIGKSGFAHFFEHMMFQGSENVADEEHFRIVTESGGTLNGTTNRDRTNYFETLPNNQLETALWLEADRMGFLLDAVTQKKFEIQRATVKNERGQNYDNRPYGLVGETTSRYLYPYGHPYSWLTIGYVEDLDRVDVSDLKKFFLRWYGPNNATVTVGGDVKPQEVVKMVEKYFGPIPRGPEVEDMEPMVPELNFDRYATLEDKVRSPQLQMVFPIPERYHKDLPALDALAEIIGGSDYSILYEKLVKPGKAIFARAYTYDSELAGELVISVRAFPGTDLGEIEKIVRESFDEFVRRGVTSEDIKRFKAGWEYNFVNTLSTVSRKVYNLAAYQTFTGNPNYFQKQLDAYMSVTPEDVNRVFKDYVLRKKAVILSVIPEGEFDLEAAEANYTINTFDYEAPEDEYQNLSYRKPQDDFDRSKQPGPGPNPVKKVPEFWTGELANGAGVIGTGYNELPVSLVQINLEGGKLMEARYPDKAGISSLMVSMLDQSTQNRSKEEFEKALDLLGGSIWMNSSSDNIQIYIMALNKDLDAVLKLAEEKLFEPGFLEEDFEREKKKHIEAIRQAQMRPSSVSRVVFNKLMYGEDDIRSTPDWGTVETAERIELDDVIAFYRDVMSGNLLRVTVVGEFAREDILSKLKFLERMENKGLEVPTPPAPPAVAKSKIFLIDKADAPHSEIRMGYPTLAYDATGEHYRSTLMNYPLGGNFNSRINLNLREDKGYTYGARSGFYSNKWGGTFVASASVRVGATDSAVTEFVKEIENFREKGVSQEELDFMKSSRGQKDAREYEALWQKANFLREILEYDLPADFTKEQEEILKEMTVEEVNELAGKYLKPEAMNLLVVGDKEKILPGLQKLGYEIVELDLEGNPVSGAGSEAGK